MNTKIFPIFLYLDFSSLQNSPEDKLIHTLKDSYPSLEKYNGYLKDENAVKDLLQNNVSLAFYNAIELFHNFEKIQNKCSNRILEYISNTIRIYNKVLQEHYEEITGEYRHDLECLCGHAPLKTIYQQILDKYGWNEQSKTA